jgi:hypothetical protein
VSVVFEGESLEGSCRQKRSDLLRPLPSPPRARESFLHLFVNRRRMGVEAAGSLGFICGGFILGVV